jgi:S-DNA-T family DNA segregation ATPase FtsK/SpoIIIE
MLRRELQPGRPVPRLRFRGPSVHLPLWLLAAGWLGTVLARLLLWAAFHPRSTVAVIVAVGLWLHPPPGWQPLLLAAAIVVGVWWARWPDSFRRQVTLRVAARRRRFHYWRDWQPAMVTAGLSLTPGLGGSLPLMRSVTTDGGTDTVRVRMLPGQTPDQWQAAAPRLATTWQLRAVRVRRVLNRPQELDLICRHRPVPVADIPRVTKLEPVEDQQPAAPRPGPFPRAPRGAS